HLARQRLGKDGKRMLVLPVPYPLLLSRRYVTTPQRKLPLLVGYVTPGTLTATIKLPPGARIGQLADPVALSGFGSYKREVKAADGQVQLRVETNLPRQRIVPDRYPAFVDFAAHVDLADEAYALIELGP
ncbi:MAG TPA: hypothetical protein PKW11_05960, partial [Pseudomonadota bacterium]|nr:hypothetical protein [Pseudomonadota bacterium]